VNRSIEFDGRVLSGLTTLAPDPERAARTRHRCREILERRAGPTASSAGTLTPRREAPGTTDTVMRTTIVSIYCIVCVLYVLALVLTTAGLHGIGR
jgi:hypothetical protein